MPEVTYRGETVVVAFTSRELYSLRNGNEDLELETEEASEFSAALDDAIRWIERGETALETSELDSDAEAMEPHLEAADRSDGLE